MVTAFLFFVTLPLWKFHLPSLLSFYFESIYQGVDMYVAIREKITTHDFFVRRVIFLFLHRQGDITGGYI